MRAKIKTNVFLIFFYNLIFSYTDLEELDVFFRQRNERYSKYLSGHKAKVSSLLSIVTVFSVLCIFV